MSTPARYQFAISSLLLITTLVAVIMSVSVMLPVLGVTLAVACVPALIRTCILVWQDRVAGHAIEYREKLLLFIACTCISTSMLALVAMPAIVVFGVVSRMTQASSFFSYRRESGFPLAVGAALAAGIAILAPFLILWFRSPAPMQNLWINRDFERENDELLAASDEDEDSV